MLKSFAITDIGRRRQLNQDVVYVSETSIGNLPNVFIVADGMGGHNAGDIAARVAVENIVDEFMSSPEREPVKLINEAIGRANAYIKRQSYENEKLQGMGTTVVLATILGESVRIANVGDSRLYLFNPSEGLNQVTVDHSLVEEMVRMGGIDKASARTHPDKNIITRALGVRETVEVDFFEVMLRKGDIILMCSDGLTNMVTDDDICRILCMDDGIKEKAEFLIESANRNGGKDNISVILIEPLAGEVE